MRCVAGTCSAMGPLIACREVTGCTPYCVVGFGWSGVVILVVEGRVCVQVLCGRENNMRRAEVVCAVFCDKCEVAWMPCVPKLFCQRSGFLRRKTITSPRPQDRVSRWAPHSGRFFYSTVAEKNWVCLSAHRLSAWCVCGVRGTVLSKPPLRTSPLLAHEDATVGKIWVPTYITRACDCSL